MRVSEQTDGCQSQTATNIILEKYVDLTVNCVHHGSIGSVQSIGNEPSVGLEHDMSCHDDVSSIGCCK